MSEPVFISESQVFDVVPGKLGKQSSGAAAPPLVLRVIYSH